MFETIFHGRPNGLVMARAELTLQIPADVWIGDLTRSFPQAEFRILAALPGDETGVGLLEITASNLWDVLSQLESYKAVSDVELFRREQDTALLQFFTTNPLLLFPIQGSGIPLETPFDIVNGQATLELTAPRDRLSELGEQLAAFNISYTVEAFQEHLEPEQLLTENQLWLLQEAVERGYYDIPRECTLTELAEETGSAKSTCSETLHRAESKIVKQFLEEKRQTLSSV